MAGEYQYQNLHTFKEELIVLCQITLKTRRITHFHGSAHFTIPLMSSNIIKPEKFGHLQVVYQFTVPLN